MSEKTMDDQLLSIASLNLDGNTMSKSEELRISSSFGDLELKPELLIGLNAYGFKEPTAIQKRVIIPSIAGRDVIVHAESESGKTAAVCIAILQRINLENPYCQALLLVPTRVMAEQTQKVIAALGAQMGVTSRVCIGGTNVKDEMRILEAGVQIIVGTPGRVFDMINRRRLGTAEIKMFVLDEADELLSRGFKDQFNKIWKKMSGGTQTILLSTSMSEKILDVAQKIMRDPLFMHLGDEELRKD